MTEKYQQWLDNPDMRQTLDAFGADNLTEAQQEAFEKLATEPFVPRTRYGKLMKIVAGGINPKLRTKDLVDNCRAITRPKVCTKAGMDPDNYLGDQSHRRNLGYIQSQRETKE